AIQVLHGKPLAQRVVLELVALVQRRIFAVEPKPTLPQELDLDADGQRLAVQPKAEVPARARPRRGCSAASRTEGRCALRTTADTRSARRGSRRRSSAECFLRGSRRSPGLSRLCCAP